MTTKHDDQWRRYVSIQFGMISIYRTLRHLVNFSPAWCYSAYIHVNRDVAAKGLRAWRKAERQLLTPPN
jgi:5-formyltetrahydrofolate cyclo-ligase